MNLHPHEPLHINCLIFIKMIPITLPTKQHPHELGKYWQPTNIDPTNENDFRVHHKDRLIQVHVSHNKLRLKIENEISVSLFFIIFCVVCIIWLISTDARL